MKPIAAIVAFALLAGPAAAVASSGGTPVETPVETPELAAEVAAGRLPSIIDRLPQKPLIAPIEAPNLIGKQGGEVRTLIARARDVRLMAVWGYARLVGYAPDLSLQPDLAERIDVVGDRVFTIHLRPGHRWSDGRRFTAEDFRYYFEDVASNAQLSPTGLPPALLVDGKPPRFEVIDAQTVRYSWDAPNPVLLSEVAAAAPLYLYRPAHYLRQFHERYVDKPLLEQRVRAAKARNWQQLHNRLDNMYRNDNPELPTLDPWINRTNAPAERFVFTRNPYFHRIDAEGRQLPYLDRVVLQVADAKIVPVKTGSGEADLQARYLTFDNYTFLKQSAKRNAYAVDLWKPGKAAHLALYPNMTVADPVWRRLMQDLRFRRALSMAINRREINLVSFCGLGTEGNHTVLKESPLYDDDNRRAWAEFDLPRANMLLDQIGLTQRDLTGYRLLPDGRPMTIVVEAAGDTLERTDVLQLIRDSWREIGVKLLVKATQNELFRNRVFSGQVIMSISSGADIGLATPDMAPSEWAPVNQQLLQWSQWGNFYETQGKAGQAPELPEAERLVALYQRWKRSGDTMERARIWREMLTLNADQVFVIGLVSGVPQPVVMSTHLRNLPAKGLFSWDPGAQFGMYRMDQIWWDDARSLAVTPAGGAQPARR
jgi:peptide/nickel transport system substrate-binding protein